MNKEYLRKWSAINIVIIVLAFFMVCFGGLGGIFYGVIVILGSIVNIFTLLTMIIGNFKVTSIIKVLLALVVIFIVCNIWSYISEDFRVEFVTDMVVSALVYSTLFHIVIWGIGKFQGV